MHCKIKLSNYSNVPWLAVCIPSLAIKLHFLPNTWEETVHWGRAETVCWERRPSIEGGRRPFVKGGGKLFIEGGRELFIEGWGRCSLREGGIYSSRKGGGCSLRKGGDCSLREEAVHRLTSWKWWEGRTIIGKFKIQHDYVNDVGVSTDLQLSFFFEN